MAITIAIICALFVVQRAGTSSIGKAFGPIMCLWFAFLGGVGIINVFADLNVLRAFNPLRGIMFLFDGNLNRAGLMVLGNVFLCTTGAEALYSDMGHVGKSNIYASWPVVKACLILNYLGQGAWIIQNAHDAELIGMGVAMNPFFQMLPGNLRIFAVVLSTLAAIIASQALITGSYSIVSEAIRLDLMPHMKINYPSENKGQIYIPLVNNILWIGCVGVVLFFRSSERMEAAYGLAIFLVMYIWHRGTQIEMLQRINLDVEDYLDQLRTLSADEELPLLADNLVFLTNDPSTHTLDRDILYSILDKRPKRARAYWFLNVAVTDEPYTHEFWVNDFGGTGVYKVQLRLGFRVNQRVNEYLYQIVDKLVDDGRLEPQNHRYSVYPDPSKQRVGDFRFCLIRKVPSVSNDLSSVDLAIIQAKYFIRRVCGSAAHWYGLQNSSLLFEDVPLFVGAKRQHKLAYVELPADTEE